MWKIHTIKKFIYVQILTTIMADNSNSIRKNITIKKYQNEWLSKHREINLSGLVQDLLDTMMSEAKNVSRYVDLLVGKDNND